MRYEVLVVEDSATQAEAVRALLEDSYEVTVASSGEEALELLGQQRFHLVLSDIVMPGMSGYELCRRVKDHPDWRDTPLVLLTSLIDPLDIVRGLEAGADNYITKPFEAEHLIDRLDQVLANRRVRQSSRTSMGVSVNFLGTELNITSDKEQILDLLLSSIEDIIRTNRALEESRRELSAAHAQLERYAREKEREAAVSAERYSALMQQAGDAIMVLDVDGTIAEANECTSDLLGYPPQEMIGRSLEDFIVPAHRDSYRSALERLILRGEAPAAEREFLRVDGSVVYCEGTKSVVDVGDGERLILAIYRDVTARKAAEAALRRSEVHLRDAQNIARLGSFERDVETGRVALSEHISQFFGFSTDRSVHDFHDLIARVHPEDRATVQDAGNRAVDQREPFDAEFRVVSPAGQIRVASVRGRPDVDEHGRVTRVLGVLQDITEKRLLERQLIQAQKMEAIGRLAGGIAHDFNNVLMAIKGSVLFLGEDLGPEHPSRPDVEDIDSSVDRAARLTRQLLAFSRQQVLQPQVVDLADLVREQQRMLRRLLPEDFEIRMEIEPDLWRIKADPGQMEQVLMNLVVNAKDAMPDGGTVCIKLANSLVGSGSSEAWAGVEPGPYVRLSVSDTGQGISDEVVEHIFEPFFTTKGEGRGTGLGLSTVYGIVQQSGGQVVVEGNAGTGAAFDVYLPRTEAPDSPRNETPPAAKEMSSATILLVEDEPEVRRSLAGMLRRHGHIVHEAGGGAEALDVLDAHEQVELIISDVVMPKMSGVDLAARVRATRPQLPFLLMSGYLDDEVTRRGLGQSGANFIQKPFERGELLRRVGELISGSAKKSPGGSASAP